MLFSHEEGKENRDSIIFLHGFLGSHADWDPFVQAFSKTHHCHAFDLPGHGSSPCVSTKQLFSEIPRNSHLVGYSMGGRLALELFCNEPDSFNSLTLISTNPGLESETAEKITFEKEWINRFQTWPIKECVEMWYQNDLFVDFSIPKRRYQQNGKGLAFALEEFSIVKRGSFWNDISQINKKVLWIFGENDIKYVAIGNRILQSSDCHVVNFIPGCSHAAHIDDPRSCITTIGRYHDNLSISMG